MTKLSLHPVSSTLPRVKVIGSEGLKDISFAADNPSTLQLDYAICPLPIICSLNFLAPAFISTGELRRVGMEVTIDLYLVTLRESASLRAARADLGTLVRWWEEQRGRTFDPTQLTAEYIVVRVRHRQDIEERKPATINRGLSTIRRFGEWLMAEHILSENPAKGIRRISWSNSCHSLHSL